MNMKLVSIDLAHIQARWAPQNAHLVRTFWPWQCRTCVPRPSRHERTTCFRVSARRHFIWIRVGSGEWREKTQKPQRGGIAIGVGRTG